MVLLLTTILIHLFTSKVPCESWSISRSSIWWEDVVCDRIVSQMPIISLSIMIGLLAKGTLLFAPVSGTVLYWSGPPLLCGTIPCGTVLLRMVLWSFTLEIKPIQTDTKLFSLGSVNGL